MRARELIFVLPGGGRALFTERDDGNMSSVSGDGAEQGRCARERLRDRTGLARHARGRQVHGTLVRRVGPGEARPGEGHVWKTCLLYTSPSPRD